MIKQLLLALVLCASSAFAVGPITAASNTSSPITPTSSTQNNLITLTGPEVNNPFVLRMESALNGGIRDNITMLGYNPTGADPTRPVSTLNFEDQWAGVSPPLGLFELHLNIQGLPDVALPAGAPAGSRVSYRPFGVSVDLNTNDANFEFLAERIKFASRLGIGGDLNINTNANGAQATITNRSTDNPLTISGGNSVLFNLATSFAVTRSTAATSGATTLNAPAIINTGRYWNGSASANADSQFVTLVTGNNQYVTSFGPTNNPWKITEAGNLSDVSLTRAQTTERLVIGNDAWYAGATTGGAAKKLIGVNSGNKIQIDPTDSGIVLGTTTGAHFYIGDNATGSPRFRGQYDASNRFLAISGGSGGSDNTLYFNLDSQSAPISMYGAVTLANNNLIVGTAGKGLQLKGGTNARIGQATLSGGTVTVSNTSVTANTRFILTPRGATNAGFIDVGTVTAGTSFVIESSNASDARTVDYVLIEQN